MTTKNIYLKNGCEAVLHEKLEGNRFVIEKILEYNYEDETIHEPSGVQEIVSEIFISPPIESIDAEIKSRTHVLDVLRTEVQELNNQKMTLRNEVYNEEQKRSKISNWIVDLSKWRNAKSIILFEDNNIVPYILSYNGKDSSNISSLHFEVSLDGRNKGKWYSSNFGSSTYIDDKYDVHFDLTEEEIIKMTHDRSDSMDLSLVPTYKMSIPEKYQTPRVKKWLSEYKESERIKKIEKLKVEIENKNSELEKLTNI